MLLLESLRRGRRPLPPGFPPSLLHHFISFDAQDIQDKLQALPYCPRDQPCFLGPPSAPGYEQTNEALNETILTNVLRSSPSSRLSHVTIQTGNPLLTARPSMSLCPDSLARTSTTRSKTSSPPTSRPSPTPFTVPPSTRGTHNALVMVAAYMAVCLHEGLPFGYPGNKYTWEHFCDMTDAGGLVVHTCGRL